VGEIPNFPAGGVSEINTFLSGKAVVPKLPFISDRVVLPELSRSIPTVVFGL